MDIPTWGKEVIKTQDEHTAKLDEHTAKLDQLNLKVDKLEAKVDKLEAKVDRVEASQADLVVFLNERFNQMDERFDEILRHIDVQRENTRSDQRAYGEQQQAQVKSLDNHSGRLERLEDSEKVVNASLRSLVGRVGALEERNPSLP